jgi:hypothetical protein
MADAAVVEQDDAAFAAGFDAAPAQAATEQEPVADAGQTQGSESKEIEPVAPAKPVLIGGMTEEAWNAAVAKAAGPLVEQARAESRKNFGQIGELKTTIKTLQEKLQAGGTPAARRKLTAEALKRVNEELPGLGDALAQDLSEFLDSPAVAAEAATEKAVAEAKGQTFDAEAFFTNKIGPALESLEARANERAELRIVKSIHRDFDAVVKSPEFVAWMGTLPEERQTEIRESTDGFVAADAVSEFKGFRDKAKQVKQKNQNRLEAGLTPSGDKQPASHIANDDEADFERAFKNTK